MNRRRPLSPRRIFPGALVSRAPRCPQAPQMRMPTRPQSHWWRAAARQSAHRATGYQRRAANLRTPLAATAPTAGEPRTSVCADGSETALIVVGRLHHERLASRIRRALAPAAVFGGRRSPLASLTATVGPAGILCAQWSEYVQVRITRDGRDGDGHAGCNCHATGLRVTHVGTHADRVVAIAACRLHGIRDPHAVDQRRRTVGCPSGRKQRVRRVVSRRDTDVTEAGGRPPPADGRVSRGDVDCIATVDGSTAVNIVAVVPTGGFALICMALLTRPLVSEREVKINVAAACDSDGHTRCG
eukprot:scaffold82388_cov35-Tisochrysis_lutea.AAC.4